MASTLLIATAGTANASDTEALAVLAAQGYDTSWQKASAAITTADLAACTGLVVTYSTDVNPLVGLGVSSLAKPVFTFSRAVSWVTHLNIAASGSQASGIQQVLVLAAGEALFAVAGGRYPILSTSVGSTMQFVTGFPASATLYARPGTNANEATHFRIPSAAVMNNGVVAPADRGIATWFSDTDVAKLTQDGRDFAGKTAAAVLGAPSLHVTGEADTTAPSAPSGVTATATGPTAATVSWSPSTDAVGVTSYRVQRGGVTVAAAVTGTTFNDAGLAASTSYSWTVSAADAAGNRSAESAAATATTPAAPAPAPTVSITGGTTPRTVVPWREVTVDGTTDQAGIAWTVSGADFTSTGSGITFTAPAETAGAVVRVTATATNAGGVSASQSLTVNVRPATLALVAGGATRPHRLDYVAQVVGSGPETFTLGTTEPTPDNTWLGLAPLQTIAGDFTPTSNTTYTRVQFTGRIIWNGTLTGVTFDDCDFAPTGSPTTDSAVVNMELATSVALFNRCRIRPQAPSGYWHSIRGRFYRMWRCLILDCVDGPGTNVTQPNTDAEPRIEGTCVQDLFYGPADYQNDGVSHADAAQLQAARMYLDGCRLWANASPLSSLVSPYDPSVPGQAVAVTPNVSPVGLTLRRSWLKHGAQSLTMIPGSQGLVAGGGLIELNRWDTRTNPALRRGGPTGPTARRAVLIDPTLTVTGMPTTTGPDTVHGNVDWDGSPLIVHRVTAAS